MLSASWRLIGPCSHAGGTAPCLSALLCMWEWVYIYIHIYIYRLTSYCDKNIMKLHIIMICPQISPSRSLATSGRHPRHRKGWLGALGERPLHPAFPPKREQSVNGVDLREFQSFLSSTYALRRSYSRLGKHEYIIGMAHSEASWPHTSRTRLRAATEQIIRARQHLPKSLYFPLYLYNHLSIFSVYMYAGICMHACMYV